MLRILVSHAAYAFLCFTKHKQIIHVHKTAICTLVHNECHISLECWWRIFEPKWHHTPLKMTVSINWFAYTKRSFLSVSWFYPDWWYPRLQIKFGEVLCTAQMM